jgi:hypothetical protein
LSLLLLLRSRANKLRLSGLPAIKNDFPTTMNTSNRFGRQSWLRSTMSVVANVWNRLLLRPRIVVLGKEHAKAAEADRRWQQRRRSQDSPLPKEGYDFWREDYCLVDPVPIALDDELRELVRRYAASGNVQRAAMRDSISMDGFYTLITFASRCSVFAMRERKAEIARDGLNAIAMIHYERVDVRDIATFFYLLDHAARRVGADPDEMFREVARMAEPEVAQRILRFSERTAERRNLRSGLFEEVETGRGPGFIHRDVEGYSPTLDLKHLSVAIANYIAADKYLPYRVSVATKLPTIWLGRDKNPLLDHLLGRARAGATISGRLRPKEHPQHKDQYLWVFIEETLEASDAKALLQLSHANAGLERCCRMGLAAGRLFALVVARPTRMGVASFETADSLTRFRDGLTQILLEYANGRT